MLQILVRHMVLVPCLAVDGPLHEGLLGHIQFSQAVDYDMYMNVAAAIVTVHVRTDQCLMPRKICFCVSTIFKVKIGKRSVAVETAKSYEPYSVVERTLVYKGTSKNTSIFDEKFAIIKTPIFLNKYLNLFSIEVPLSIYAPLKIIKAFINRLNIL